MIVGRVMNFSILMSVYNKERPSNLEECLVSLENQSLAADELILVQDGPIRSDLLIVIEKFRATLNIISVEIEENAGLANALNVGMNYCNFELIIRMDSDDVAFPDRFYKQVSFMSAYPDIAVSSGCIEEWDQNLSHKLSVRTLPLDHYSISRMAKSRSPISHPAAIFKKSAVLSVGGYPDMYPEDYPLWANLITEGYKCANLPDPLLKMRVGDALIERRGISFLKGEINIFLYLEKINFINKLELLVNIATRLIVRLSPLRLKKVLYKYFR